MMGILIALRAEGAGAIAMILAAKAAALIGIGGITPTRQIITAPGRREAYPARLVARVAIGAIIIFVIFAATFRFLVTEPAADFITRAIEKAPLFGIIVVGTAAHVRSTELAARAIAIVVVASIIPLPAIAFAAVPVGGIAIITVAASALVTHGPSPYAYQATQGAPSLLSMSSPRQRSGRYGRVMSCHRCISAHGPP